MGFLGSSNGKESVCNAGGLDSIPVLEGSPGEGNIALERHVQPRNQQ